MLRRIRSGGEDAGYTMVAVLLAFLLTTALALASLAYAVSTVGQSRESQDYRAALAAAQAGVQDYVSRLNSCDTYWDVPCGDSTTNLALTGWATIPGTTGTNTARYSQRVLSDPLSTVTPGEVRLQVTGEVNGERRTIVADLAKTAFLRFLYYSDYETFSPASTARLSTYGDDTFTVGSNTTLGTVEGFAAKKNTTYTLVKPTEEQVREGCQRYYYDGRSTFPRTVQWTEGSIVKTARVWFGPNDPFPSGITVAQVSCLVINFGAQDTIDGPLHTNDTLSLSGNATFNGRTETSWPSSGVVRPATDQTRLWLNTGYTPNNNRPVYEPRLDMPPTNLNIRRLADAAQGGAGCLYTGPTSIEFLANGRMKVKSPQTISTNANCINGSGGEVSGPSNGVIYVQDLPASPTDPNYRASCSATHPIPEYTQNTGDDSEYDCRSGDVFVKGTVKGKFTVASSHDVIVTGNVVYDGGLGSRNVLGLVGTNNVEVYHPADDGVRLTNLRIDAAIASVQNSFTVQNYSVGSAMGTLTLNGVIVQRFRGPVAQTSSGTVTHGYGKDYNYDTRLTALPPPSFLELQSDAWSSVGFSEETPN